MDMVLRGAAIYFAVWVILRLSGRRTLSQMTTFDFVLLLIISEATQQALLGEDFSLTKSVIVVVTFVWMDRTLGMLRESISGLDALFDGIPMLIVRDGVPVRERMDREFVDDEDILHAARHLHGIERLDQVKHAVLESSGGISVIPREKPEQSQK